MKNKSFFFNILISYITIILLFSIILFLFTYNIIRTNYIINLKKELISNAILIEKIIKDDFIKENVEIINKNINDIGNELKKRITIIKSDGTVIADSQRSYKFMEKHHDRPEIITALNNQVGESQRYSDTLKLNMLYIAIPFKKENTIIGVIRVSVKVKKIREITRTFQVQLLIISLILSFFAIIFSFIISKKITDPIKKLTLASKEVAKGNFDTRVYLNNNNEISILAHNFNNMTNRLYTSIKELKMEKEELNSIITSMKEGLLVINNNGKIIRYNESFLNIANLINVKIEDKYYWEIIRHPNIIEFIKGSNTKNKNFVKEIYLDEKILLCSINYLKSNKGYILIFYDITRLKNVEIIKKDFVSNVSHELRTPLTAIKGFAETLLEEEKNKSKTKYLNIILKHSERLINIVKDLLILSEIEKTHDLKYQKTIKFEDIDIKKLVLNIISMFEDHVKEKNLEIELSIKNEIKQINGDSFKLEQMLINLIDNAIKYTDQGKIEVIISASDTPDYIQLEVKDSGIGIPTKDVSRLFERFYVVDKSRTKKNGGTGLGLSIVKHVVQLHRGEIEIISELGKGTSIIVKLPKKIKY